LHRRRSTAIEGRIMTYSILVNSTDSFEDCWSPFFHLFSKYWPDCKHKIYLNTEMKEFTFPGQEVICTRVFDGDPDMKLTWSECLRRCLDRIDTDIVLYFQEDYFLNAPVDVMLVDTFVKTMIAEHYAHVSLVTFSNRGPWRPTNDPLLWEVDQNAPYRLSLQAGLWHKGSLRSYLRPHENPWQFEVWGSKRSHRVKEKFANISRDVFGKSRSQVIPYVPTGVVKGKWNRDVVDKLFREHGIELDFSKRGFYDPSESDVQKASLVRRALARFRSLF
jgi:hypothetical protein